MTDHIGLIRDVDWIVEAAFEKIEVKQEIHKKLAEHASPHALITTNTSGIPLTKIVEGLSVEHKRRFFGTHFFVTLSPPRMERIEYNAMDNMSKM